MQRSVNIFEAGPFQGRLDLGALAGSSQTAAYLYEIAPGEASCPYHYEYVEEWMLVVAGEATVRTPDGEETVKAGELVRLAAGPDGAHRMSNRGPDTLRMLILSEMRAPAVSVYPDSDKIGLWAGEDMDSDLFFPRSAAVTWAHGEDGWDRA
jgi:uncharacterized cupin superfamily protein